MPSELGQWELSPDSHQQESTCDKVWVQILTSYAIVCKYLDIIREEDSSPPSTSINGLALSLCTTFAICDRLQSWVRHCWFRDSIFSCLFFRCGGEYVTLMHHHLRRFLNEDILSSIPPGVNPFKYLLRLAAPALSYSIASSSTQYIFWVLFILHWLIVLFCLVVLLLLYQRGVKQFLWLVRRLNIEDKNGKTGLSIMSSNISKDDLFIFRLVQMRIS
jgi:hypothetical protein